MYNENNYNLIDFKVRDREYIEKELLAFCSNFEKGITIFKREGYSKKDISYVIYVGNLSYDDLVVNDYCYRVGSLDELKGFLYGMVKANNGCLNLFKGV